MATETGQSHGDVIESLLANNKESTFVPRSSSTPAAVALVEMDKMKELMPLLCCPTHNTTLKCTLSCRGMSPHIKGECPERGCDGFVFWGTEQHDVEDDSSRKNPVYSKSRVSNQLAFALTTMNATEGDRERFCKSLGAQVLSKTYFENFRSRALHEIASVWEEQEPLYQELAQTVGDRHLEMDGSYSQRRNAQHCFVTMFTSQYHLIVLSACASKKELNLSSQGLELELCTMAVTAMLKCPLQVKSITHDEHAGVTKMLLEMAAQLPEGFEQRHDGWHRKKFVAKFLPSYLEALKLKKNHVDDIVNKTLMYLNSAFHAYAGDITGFAKALREIPSCFPNEEERTRTRIAQFLKEYFPEDQLFMYVSDTNTSDLEAFHGHHHQFVDKARFFYMYKERTYLHNLMWNSVRLEELIDKLGEEHVTLPEGLLRRDDWIRAAQRRLGLVILPAESEELLSRRKQRKEKKKTSQGKTADELVKGLLEVPPNPFY